VGVSELVGYGFVVQELSGSLVAVNIELFGHC